MAESKEAKEGRMGVPASEANVLNVPARPGEDVAADAAKAKKVAEAHSPVEGVTLAYPADAAHHPAGEPEREADKTPYPVPNDAELHDPPIRVAKPNTPGIRTLATGAGAHTPPDPTAFDVDGRPLYDRVKAGQGKSEA
jgi:hypothetical protein